MTAPYCGLLADGSGPAAVPADLVGYCGPDCAHCGPEPVLAVQDGVHVCAADWDYERDGGA